ncbi:MAG: class I mannose-6-phosphate isomerase, partial [Planctomycetes bacterium]|nr:class I mannose-6-phosphate isomerase [Planctomycetota bacterium]
DAPTARALGGEPKAEAWVVLEAPPGSELYCGLADGVDAGALRRALAGGDVRACLRRLDVKAGDCVFVPAGTVHAMGKGLLLAEIQQNSDTTYRLHDWNRKGLDGRPRALHIEEAFKSLRQDPAAGLRAGRTIRSADGIHRTIWIEEGPFTLQRMTFDALKRWRLDPGCLCVGVLEGKGRLGPEIYSPGEWWLLGAECSARTLVAETTTTLLLATPR